MDPISDCVGKTLDFSTLQTNMKTITELHFHSAIGRIAMRMVPCKNICNLALQTLCEVRAFSEGCMETHHSITLSFFPRSVLFPSLSKSVVKDCFQRVL